jgi:hypothetical protein
MASIAAVRCSDVMQSGGINTITPRIGRVSKPRLRAAKQTSAADFAAPDGDVSSIPAMKPHCRISFTKGRVFRP